MIQVGLRNVTQLRSDIRFLGQNRLPADVSRGRHQRSAELIQQQMMQGTVGQHDADFVAAPAQCSPQWTCHPSFSPARWGASDCAAIVRPRSDSTAFSPVHPQTPGLGKHHRQWFIRPRFELTQPFDGGTAGCITHQVITTDAFHCDEQSRRVTLRNRRTEPPGIANDLASAR